MVINYFDKFNIDTSEIEEKLQIISSSNTENASYISNTFVKVLEYLFTPIDLNTDNLYVGIPQDLKDVDAIIYFDTILKDSIPEIITQNNIKTIIIGNHECNKSNDNVEYINIKDLKKIKKILKSIEKVYIGFNLNNIDFSKYYYGRMRSYFLNVLNSLNKISIEELKSDIEKSCTNILLEKTNFDSKYIVTEEKIKFKEMMNVYNKFLKEIGNNKIREKYLFYISNEDISEIEKNILNELSLLLEILNIKDKKERISKVYDIVCDRMQKEVLTLNYCNFIDNKCVTMRYTTGFPNSKENGCCSNTYMDRKKDCRYLNKDHSCSICSISCRVFTCKYLQDRGIDHGLGQYPILDCTLGRIKKQKVIFSFFTPKEKMMKKLR